MTWTKKLCSKPIEYKYLLNLKKSIPLDEGFKLNILILLLKKEVELLTIYVDLQMNFLPIVK